MAFADAQGRGGWSDGLCACCSDPGVALKTCCCPGLAVNHITIVAPEIGSSSNWYTMCCLGCILCGGYGAQWGCMFAECQYRTTARTLYGIPEGGCPDCCVVFCCQCCALAQLHRHIDRYPPQGLAGPPQGLAAPPQGIAGGMTTTVNGKVNNASEDQPRSGSNSVSVGPIPGIGTQPKTTRALPMPEQPYDGSGAEQGVNPPDYASIADDYASIADIPAGQAPYFRGNIDRKTAQNELRNKPVGSFLIREKGGSDNLVISTVVRAAQNSNSAQYRHDVIVVESNGGVDSVYGQVVNESIGQQFKIDGKVVGNPPASTLAEVVQYLLSDASWLGVQLTTENTMDDYEWPTGSPGIGQGLGGRLSVNNW
eukprot:gene13572-17095_t